MRLRNKKTGEIIETDAELSIKEPTYPAFGCPAYDIIASYNSLAELAEEWEDYEEPEEDFWKVDSGCETYGVLRAFNQNDSDDVLFNKSIGNYFKTKEEAEKAVEKLKAWKRLEDKGFRFEGWEMDGTIWFETKLDEQEWSPKYRDDLDLLFGGEE